MAPGVAAATCAGSGLIGHPRVCRRIWQPAGRASPPLQDRRNSILSPVSRGFSTARHGAGMPPRGASVWRRLEDANRLLAASEDDPLGTLYVLALTTGMRLGELLGLRWQDIDWMAPGCPCRLRSSVLAGRGSWRSPRQSTPPQYDPPHRAVRSLRGHAVAEKRQRLLAGAAWEDHGLVFTIQSQPRSPSTR